MRAIVSLTLLCLMIPCASSKAALYVDQEFKIVYNAYAPSWDFYDSAWGIEAELQRWRSDTFGYAIVGGLHEWTPKRQPSQLLKFNDTLVLRRNFAYIPLGAHFLYRPIKNEYVSLTFAAGGRFAVGATTATVDVNVDTSSGTNSARAGGMDVGTSFMANLSADLEWRFSENLYLMGGVGYQQDITKGEVAFAGSNIADNELSAPFFRIGVVVDM
jgi:hypothetical protein